MTQQSRKYAIGKWCRIGAWAIVIFSAGYIVWLLAIYPRLGPPNISPLATVLFYTQAATLVLPPLLTAIFNFLVLYALGAACDHFFGQAPGRTAAPLNADYDREESAL